MLADYWRERALPQVSAGHSRLRASFLSQLLKCGSQTLMGTGSRRLGLLRSSSPYPALYIIEDATRLERPRAGRHAGASIDRGGARRGAIRGFADRDIADARPSVSPSPTASGSLPSVERGSRSPSLMWVSRNQHGTDAPTKPRLPAPPGLLDDRRKRFFLAGRRHGRSGDPLRAT